MMRCLLSFTAALALGLIAASQALALESDSRQPIQVAADRLQIDDRAGTAVYTGNVHMVQGSMKLDATRVTIKRADSGGVASVTAKGTSNTRAYIEQKPNPDDPLVRGWGDTLIYHADTRRVEMIGNAELHQGEDTFNGGYVQYHLDSRQVDARGARQSGESGNAGGQNGRVHMTLTPNNGDQNQNQQGSGGQ